MGEGPRTQIDIAHCLTHYGLAQTHGAVAAGEDQGYTGQKGISDEAGYLTTPV